MKRLNILKLYLKTFLVTFSVLLVGVSLMTVFAVEEDVPGTFSSFGTPSAPLIMDFDITRNSTPLSSGSALTPRLTYGVTLDVVDTNGVDTLSKATFKFIYYAGTMTEAIAFEENAFTQTSAEGDLFVYQWERNLTNDAVTFGEVSSSDSNTWLVTTSSMPSFADLTEFDTTLSFTFTPSKIARQTTRGYWHLVVQVEDEEGLTAYRDITGLNMNSYAELSVDSGSQVDFGLIESGTDYDDNGSANLTGINYITNFIQEHEVYASSTWTSDQLDPADLQLAEAFISNDGTPDNYREFAIKVNDSDDLSSSLQLKDTAVLTGTFGSTYESGYDGEYYFYIKLPELFLNGTYSGTISVVLSGGLLGSNVAVNEDSSELYTDLQTAFNDASQGDTVRLLGDVSGNFTMSKPLDVDFDGYEMDGHLTIEVFDSSNAFTIDGNGTLTGDLSVDAPNSSITTDLNVLGDINVLSVNDESLTLRGTVSGTVNMRGRGRLNTVLAATTSTIDVLTEELVILAGNVATVRNSTTNAVLRVEGNITTLEMNASASIFLSETTTVNAINTVDNIQVVVLVDDTTAIPDALSEEVYVVDSSFAAVNVTTETEYTTVQSAIDSAVTGDIVVINSGTYNENITLNKAIKLLGDEQTVIFNGTTFNVTAAATIRGLQFENYETINLNASNITFIRNTVSSSTQASVGLTVTGSNVLIQYNEMSDYDTAILINATSDLNTITIADNSFDDLEYGVKTEGSESITSLVIRNNLMTNANTTNNTSGVLLDNAVVNDSQISGNTFARYALDERAVVGSATLVNNVTLNGVALTSNAFLAELAAVNNLVEAVQLDLSVEANFTNAEALLVIAETALSNAEGSSGLGALEALVDDAKEVIARQAFLEDAQAITSITTVASNVQTMDDGDDTYTIHMTINEVAFDTLDTLGVESVDFGEGAVSVTPANSGIFLDELQALLGETPASAPVTLTLNYSASINQTNYAAFEADFTVNFTFTADVYNDLIEDEARAAFLEEAQKITEVGDVADNVETSQDGDNFVITMDIVDAAFGTGVFNLIETLGVTQVDLGNGLIDAIPSNVGQFLDVLELAFETYDTNANTYLIVITYDAVIDQDGYVPFTAEFTVTFDFTGNTTLFDDMYQSAIDN